MTRAGCDRVPIPADLKAPETESLPIQCGVSPTFGTLLPAPCGRTRSLEQGIPQPGNRLRSSRVLNGPTGDTRLPRPFALSDEDVSAVGTRADAQDHRNESPRESVRHAFRRAPCGAVTTDLRGGALYFVAHTRLPRIAPKRLDRLRRRAGIRRTAVSIQFIAEGGTLT